ncbi:MAG TPA: nitrate reductase, partial [Burkholderiales bacterium]|nr:nitrate reductase [Burkholderiales bacterium]
MTKQNRYLMCEPTYFDVSYIINPWMQGNVRGTSLPRAHDQWHSLHDAIAKNAKIEFAPARPG